MAYQGYPLNPRGRGRGRGGGSFGPSPARGKGRGRGRDDRFSPYARNVYDSRDEDHYHDNRGFEGSTSPIHYDTGSYKETRHHENKYKREESRSTSRSCYPRRGYYDRDAVDISDTHAFEPTFTSSPRGDSRLGFGSDHRPRGRGGVPARGRGRGRGRGIRGRGGVWRDRSRSREWSADHRRYPTDEGADYGFQTSADSNDFHYDDEYADGAIRSSRHLDTSYNVADNDSGQRHNNSAHGTHYYGNENIRDQFGGGGGDNGPHNKYRNQYNSLPLPGGGRQKHQQHSGRYGQHGHFKGVHNKANSDHEMMHAKINGHDRNIGGITDAGRFKRDIPIAPKEKDVRRTLFMRTSTSTVVYNEDIAEWFSEFGEVADVCNLIGRSGICYVMFYDSRGVQQALENVGRHVSIGSAHLTLQPSRPRPDAIGRCPKPDDYQASVLLSLEGSDILRGFTESDRALFEKHGDVCDFYSCNGLPNEWIIEYYDARSAHEAALACHGMLFVGGTIYTTFIWDGSVSRTKPRYATAQGAAGSNESNGENDFVSVQGGRNGEEFTQEASVSYPYSTAHAHGDNAAVFQQGISNIHNADSRSKAPQSSEATLASSNITTNDRVDVLSKLTLDPSLLKKAQAAKEILQQHKGLLGLDLPNGRQTESPKWSADSNTENTPLSPVVTAVDVSMESDPSKVDDIQNQEPSFNSHVCADTHADRYNPPKRHEPLVSSLLLSGVSTKNGDTVNSATTVTADAELSAPEYSLKDGNDYLDTSKMILSPFDVLPILDTTEDQQQRQESGQILSTDSQAGDTQDQSDGISRLLGILAQVQKSAYDEVKK